MSVLLRKISSQLLRGSHPRHISPLQKFVRSEGTSAEETLSGTLEKTINSVTLLGRVGADPQKRGTDEHPVVVFSLATHVNYRNEKDQGTVTQKTEWHRICIFKPGLRDVVYNYVQKGQRVHVTGKLSYGEITDSSGVSRPTTSIVAEDVIFFKN